MTAAPIALVTTEVLTLLGLGQIGSDLVGFRRGAGITVTGAPQITESENLSDH